MDILVNINASGLYRVCNELRSMHVGNKLLTAKHVHVPSLPRYGVGRFDVFNEIRGIPAVKKHHFRVYIP